MAYRMDWKWIKADDVETAIKELVPFLEDTSYDAPKAIYFDGWHEVGASAVIRAIAERPPPSLREKFDKIIHIDCSRWKSQRALQKEIADELKLTQQVAADFDAQDEEDDFSGLDQGSRAAIGDVARVIARSVAQYRCLVVLHNGSNGMVDLLSCGIPPVELFGSKVLWTLRGRLYCSTEISEKVPSSHLCLRCYDVSDNIFKALLAEEAREITLYTHNLGLGVTPEIATECCLYLLSLNHRGGDLIFGDVIDFNWVTHASSYWVCDGIVEGGQDNQAWELARALQQQMRLEDYSSNTLPDFGYKLYNFTKHWIAIVNANFKEVPPGTTSLFFAPPIRSPHVSFPNDGLHGVDQLRVLKLCRCTFSFSSPPFHCCHNLRFLGLDRCMDEEQQGEKEKQIGAQAVETFQRLWVLDVCHTDWELDFPLETEEPVVATDIREVHINKGRIWRSNLAWRRLPNLHKLRVDEPTSSWETGRKDDEFKDMVKLELLDLSRNSTIQVLPSISGAANLRTLVLDGCVGLEHVGPQGLPPSLESFCLDAGADKDPQKNAKISSISLAGCARLVDFRLRGPLPKLEEIDLSHTQLIVLDLEKVSQAGNLERVLLVGCKRLRSISWPNWGWVHHRLKLLCIDTRAGGEVATKPSSCDSLMACQGEEEEEEKKRKKRRRRRRRRSIRLLRTTVHLLPSQT